MPKKSPQYFMGIDPGLQGAIAIIDPTKRSIVAMIDMPITKTKPPRVNVSELAQVLCRHAPSIRLATVEEFWPGKFVNGAYRLGLTLGQVHGILETLQVPILKSPGREWKKSFGLSKDKDASRAKASQLFPVYEDLFGRVKDDGRAEAAILACHGHAHECVRELNSWR